MKTQFLLGAAAALLASGGAFAQSAGSFVVHAGTGRLNPPAPRSDLAASSLAGTQVDVTAANSFVGGITYFWTDHLSIDLPVTAPFKYDIVGAGALQGAGKLGTVKSLPITLLAQYRFGDADSRLRPFVGAGPTYSRFSTLANPTTLSMKSRLGMTAEVGVAYNVTNDWSANLSLTKTFIKTTGGLPAAQAIETSLDPVSIKFGIGYRF